MIAAFAGAGKRFAGTARMQRQKFPISVTICPCRRLNAPA
jgi:hypothetical protein